MSPTQAFVQAPLARLTWDRHCAQLEEIARALALVLQGSLPSIDVVKLELALGVKGRT